MEYIKEYNIFNSLRNRLRKEKKKEDQKVVPKKDLFIKFSSATKSVSRNADKDYVVITTHGYNNEKEAIIGKNDDLRIEYLNYKIEGNDDYRISSWPWVMSSEGWTQIDLLCQSLEGHIIKLGIHKGVNVYIEDKNINGKVDGIYTGVFAQFSFSDDIKKGTVSKILQINGNDGRKYFRLPSQVNVIKEGAEVNLSLEFKDIIEDYLLEITESDKFIVKITPIEDQFAIVYYVEINFKNDIDLDSATFFLRNINTLKKRLDIIEKCDMSIEDLTKKGIKIKVSKQPVKENFLIKEYAFWNKDNKLGDKILKSLYLVKPKDIEYQYVSAGYSGGPKYTFNLKDFNIVCQRQSDEHDNFLQGYSVIVDGVELDISGNQARKILNKIKEIYESPKREDDDFIKKDLNIALENNEQKECEMCGEAIFGDQDVCDDCKKSQIEIETPKEKKVSFVNTVPAYPKSQQIYYESLKYGGTKRT